MRNFLITLLFIFSSLSLFAGEGSWVQRFVLGELVPGTPYTMLAPSSGAYQESFAYVNRVGLVHLDYTRKDHSDIDFGNDWRVWVTLSYSLDGANYPVHQTKTLLIQSGQGLDQYSDYIKFGVTGDGYTVKISKIEGQYHNGSNWVLVNDPQYDSRFPVDIDFRTELREEHWYDLDVSASTFETSDLDFDPTTYRANWGYFQGAEQYDFEWVWIDAKSAEYAQVTVAGVSNELPFELKEPSRVRVSQTHHTIDKTYSEGKLFFRVRGISKYTLSGNGGIYDQIKEGEWSYDNQQGTTVSSVISNPSSFEKDKNWLYGIAYAEEGKSVSSVTFYDGSNRGRQSLTYNTSDDITLVGESKFDFEGRQTVSVIPAPVKGRSLGYHTQFNLVAGSSALPLTGTDVFDEDDYDFGTYNSTSAQQLASVDGNDATRELGAAQYFSGANKFDEDLFRAAIPDANGYVYSQTVYRNDGTGRIEEVGGIGETFRVGGDHSVKTYYGSTNVVELQRLFGSNVSSNPNGYRKEMVRDANGQHSVTYYDKRGNVIATALSGESPENLLALEDQDPVMITTSLNDNNLAVDDYTKISEHTFLNSVVNQTISLDYTVNGIVNPLATTPIDVNGHTVLLGDFCSTCRYTLTIEVINQSGGQVNEVNSSYGNNQAAPFVINVDPSGNCYDANGVVLSGGGVGYSTPSLQYNLTDIGEYRIIKTLSVNQEDMQDAFDNQLNLSGANDPSSFVAEYISNVDISGCFTNCDDYCYWYIRHTWPTDHPTNPTWSSTDENDLANLTQDQLDAIDACKSGMCDIDEMYQNFDSETAGSTPTVSPMEQGCEGYKQQMLQQISPGGVFYDNTQSGFWTDVSANAPISIGGQSYTVTQLQDPSIYTPEMAEALLIYHRENCHLQLCSDWAATMDYSNALMEEIGETAWPAGNVSTGVFLAPYNPSTPIVSPLITYTNGDPFLGQAWNLVPPSGSFTLDGSNGAVDDYASYINYGGTGGAPVLDNPVSTTNSTTAPAAFSTSNSSLFSYVNHVVNLIERDNENHVDANNQPDPILLSSEYYNYQRKLMFKGIYDQIKMELIKEYKETTLSCYYQIDDNAVFMGPISQQEMEQEIAGALSGVVNSTNCAEQAYQNTVDWLGDIPESCLEDLADIQVTNPIRHDLSFGNNPTQDQATLLAGTPSGGTPTIEQLMYDYVMATCSTTNPLGLFFNPDVNDASFDPQDPSSVAYQTASEPGEAEYIEIYQLLINCNLTNVPPLFEEIPAPTPNVTNIINQNDLDCIVAFMDMVNDGLSLLDPQSLGSTNCAPNVVACSSATITADQTNYPALSDPSGCGLDGLYEFTYADYSTSTDYSTQIRSALSNSCRYSIWFVNTNDLTSPQGYITSLSNPVKHSTLNVGIGASFQILSNVITFQATLSDGSIELVYLNPGEDNLCHPFGNFDDDQVITFPDAPGPLPDYESDCIEATIGQATIDALNAYNNILNDLQSAFQESMATCIASASENFAMSYELKEYQYTLYYYDLAGNLVQTVPPQGVDIVPMGGLIDPGTPTDPSDDYWDGTGFNPQNGTWSGDEPEHRMETRYKYNGLNTLIAQYTPDGGHSDFILDKLYRVRYSQNARQEDVSTQRASYTQYDELGRVQEAGEFYMGDVSGVTLSLNDLSGLVEDNTFPSATRKMDYTHTYYEEVYPNDPTIASKFAGGEQKNLRNTIAAIEHVQTGEIGGITAVNTQAVFRTVISYSYDPHKNVKEMVSTNYHLESIGQQHKTVRYEYDLISGNVNELIYQQDQVIQLDEANGIEEQYSDEYRHKYHYDANNRLIRAFTSKDGGTTWDKEAKYFYYLHGALARTEIGEDEVQGIDYAYNLQGWLKGVNASSLYASRDLGHDADATGDNQFFGTDVFGFMLTYFDNDYQSIVPTTAFADMTGVADQNIDPSNVSNNSYRNLFNGNISNMSTAMRDFDEVALTVLSNNYQYDQLQRIRSMKVYYSSIGELAAGNHFDDALLYNNGAYRTSYTFDKNGNLKTLDRYGDDGALKMDEFNYTYYDQSTGTGITNSPNESNRLANVQDLGSLTGNYVDIDIDEGQIPMNYEYDASGQLISDDQEGIQEIVWSVTGKVKEIKFTAASGKNDLKFVYDPMDMRVMKIQYNNTDKTDIKYTYYSYDAQGNTLATYSRTIAAPRTQQGEEIYEDKFYLEENMVYGSSRLGIDNRVVLLTTATIDQSIAGNTNIELAENFVWTIQSNDFYSQSHRIVGRKYYELSNHLGNVLEVISDRKTWIDNNGTKVYSADVISYSDYYPYGMLLPGRHGSEADADYRYSFQGQEHDDEVKGKGNSVNYKYRMHDPRVGRFFALDPLMLQYAELTPYQFSSNCPIGMVEIEGLEGEWKRDIQLAQRDMEAALDNGASRDQALKVYHNTLNALQPFRRMPDEAAYIIFGGVVVAVVAVVGVEVTVVWVSKEVAEAVFEELSGVPIIDGPEDIVEFFTKRGLKRKAAQDAADKLFKRVQYRKFNAGKWGDDIAEQYSKGVIKSHEQAQRLYDANIRKFVKSRDGKSWSSSKYRNNLQLKTGKIAKGYDAHHTFVKSQADWFKKKGIDVNDPANMVWRDAKTHSSTTAGSANSRLHKKLWDDYIENNPNATKEQILKQRDVIEKKVWGNTTGDNPAQ